MYNQTYEDYMSSFLGYPNYGYRNSNFNMNAMNNIGNMNTMGTMGMNSINNMGMNPMWNMNMMTNDPDLEHLYPETYKIIYPMVCSACDKMQFPGTNITNEVITRMTDDIYDRVESDGRINVEATVEVRESDKETRQRRPRNRFLRDFIRVLLLRELFRRRRFPGRFPIRPF